MQTIIFIASHGGASGHFSYGYSTFEDFEQIMSLVREYLAIRLDFFGVSLSISEVIICSILFTIVFGFVLKIFGGD